MLAKNKWLLLGYLLLAVFSLPAIAKRMTHSFHVSRLNFPIPIESSFAVANRQPLAEVQKILSQDFRYLGRGSQAFVFSSRDGRYVLKLFLFDSPKDTIVRQFFHCSSSSLGQKWEERAMRTLLACRIAYEQASDETGLVYMHLQPTDDLFPSVSLKGPSFKNATIPLDSFRFALQLRTQPFDGTLLELYKKKDLEQFRLLVQDFLSLLSRRIARGVFNTDPTLFDNFGFFANHAYEIDFGNYVFHPEWANGSVAREEKARYTRQLLQWAQENTPKWKEVVAGLVQNDL